MFQELPSPLEGQLGVTPGVYNNILKVIENEVGDRFSLAIETEKWQNYYKFPLIIHGMSQENGEVYLNIRLKVPLVQKKGLSEFKLLTPSYNGFPCISTSCYRQTVEKGKMLSFYDNQRSFLYNEFNHHIEWEINLDHAECITSGQERNCFTFLTSLLTPTTECTKGILEWNEDKISHWCRFKLTHRSEYRAIQISPYKFLIHPKVVSQYFELCDKSVMKEFPTNEKVYSEILQLYQGCDVIIPQTRQKLMAPFGEVLTKPITYEHISFQSTLIEKLSKRFDPSFETLPMPSFLADNQTEYYNETYWRIIDDEINNEELSKMTKEIVRMTTRLNTAMSKVTTRVNKISFQSSFWSYFSLLGKLIQAFTTVCVIVWYLSKVNFFGLLTTAVVLNNPVNAETYNLFPDIQVLPDIKIFPEFTVEVLRDSMALSYLIDVSVLLICLFFVLLTIFCSRFRKVQICHCYGSYRLNSTRSFWSLMISFQTESRCLLHTKVEVINIRIPLPEFVTESYRMIDLKEPINICVVRNNGGERELILSEGVHLYAINEFGQRTRNVDKFVMIPLREIKWTKSKPKSLKSIIFTKASLKVMKNMFSAASVSAFDETHC